MKEGLLIYDDDPKTDLAEKVGRAARRYRQKYSEEPNVCHVHPSALDSKEMLSVGGVHVRPLSSVLRHHFWVGREKEEEENTCSK